MPADEVIFVSLVCTVAVIAMFWIGSTVKNLENEFFVLVQLAQGAMTIWFSMWYGVLGLLTEHKSVFGFVASWVIIGLILIPGSLIQCFTNPRMDPSQNEPAHEQDALNLPLAASEDPPPPELMAGGKVTW